MMLTGPRECSQLGRYSMTRAIPSTAVVVENSSSLSLLGLRTRICRRVESATGGGGDDGGRAGAGAGAAPAPVGSIAGGAGCGSGDRNRGRAPYFGPYSSVTLRV